MKIYVASSWRNPHYETVVAKLREKGHKVNDWRDSAEGPILAPWEKYMDYYPSSSGNIFYPEDFANAMTGRKEIRDVYRKDMRLMGDSDVCVLLTPCGRSAHLELGYMAGRSAHTVVLLKPGFEPELMYGVAEKLVTSITELCWWISWLEEKRQPRIVKWYRAVRSVVKLFWVIKKQQWKNQQSNSR